MIAAIMRALKTGVLDDLLGAAAQTAAARNIPMRQVMAEAEESLVRMARANPNVAKRAQDINLTGLIRGHTEGKTIMGKSAKIAGAESRPTFIPATPEQRAQDVANRIKRAVPEDVLELYRQDGSTPASVGERIVDLDEAGALGAEATRGRIRANMYDPPPATSTRAELAEALEAELLDDPDTSLLNEPAQRPIGLIPGTRKVLQPVAPQNDRLMDLAEVAAAQRKTPAPNDSVWGGAVTARSAKDVQSVEPLGRDAPGGYARFAETQDVALPRALSQGGGTPDDPRRGGGGAYLVSFDDGRGGQLWAPAQKVVKSRTRQRGEQGWMAGDLEDSVSYRIPADDEAIHLTREDAIAWADQNVRDNRTLLRSDAARTVIAPDANLTYDQRRMRQRGIRFAEADARGGLSDDLVSERAAWQQPTPDQLAESPIRRQILGGEGESRGLSRFGGGAPPPPRPAPNPTASGVGGGVVRSPMPEEGITSPWSPPSGRTGPSSPPGPMSMMDELDAMRPRSTGMVPRGVSPTQARYWDERFGPERRVPWIQSLLGLGGLALLPAGAYAMAEAGGEEPWL